jgi:eukaryotic-like serine/threonine-protein kinase
VAAVEPGRVLQRRYRLDEHVAVGGMGEVWQGTDLVLDRKVAVKLLRPEHADDRELIGRFRAEARMAGLLSHPNIAQVFDFCEATPPDPAYLVMEFVDGSSLAGLLHDGPLEPAQTMDIVAQAARGLAAAHRAGLVHRDVKPGNLLVRSDGLVKVSDFGIARAESVTPITRTGLLPGTPGYMAPERAAGQAATPAADLYSLGVVAHQCLTGRPPFEGEFLAVAIAHMERDMPPLPASVPRQVAALVGELTRKDPRARPSSAQDVATRAEGLRAILAGSARAAPVLADAAPPVPGPAAAGTAVPVLAADAPTRQDTRPSGALPAPATAEEGARSLRQLPRRIWAVPRHLSDSRLMARRLPGVWRLASGPVRAAVAVLAVVLIGGAGLAGWLLGVSGSPPARPPQAPPAASRPSPQAPGQPTQNAFPGATPAAAPSPRPSPSVTTPAATPSASPTPSPSATPSPTTQPSPTQTPTPNPTSSTPSPPAQ